MKAKAKHDQEIKEKEVADRLAMYGAPIQIIPPQNGGGLTVAPKYVKKTTGSYSSASTGDNEDLPMPKRLRIKGSSNIGSISISKMMCSDGEEEESSGNSDSDENRKKVSKKIVEFGEEESK